MNSRPELSQNNSSWDMGLGSLAQKHPVSWVALLQFYETMRFNYYWILSNTQLASYKFLRHCHLLNFLNIYDTTWGQLIVSALCGRENQSELRMNFAANANDTANAWVVISIVLWKTYNLILTERSDSISADFITGEMFNRFDITCL